MDAIDRIDAVLMLISTNPSLKTNARDIDIFEEYLKAYPEVSKDTYEGSRMTAMLDKLVKDGYISKKDRPVYTDDGKILGTSKQYAITFEGDIFCAQGGYEGQIARQNAESIRVANVEKRQKANERRMTYLTVILAVSAFFAIPYYLTEMLKTSNILWTVSFLAGIFVTLSVVITLLIIWLVISEIRQLKK